MQNWKVTPAEVFAASPLVPVMVINDLEQALPMAKALLDGGISVFEITLRTPVALDAIALIAKAMPDAMVGAGTVLNCAQFDAAVAAGARFVISPGMTPALLAHAAKSTAPLIPGVATPSEVMQALEAGYDHLKFFPAEANGGTKALSAIAAPLPQVKFCPTGGIGPKNVADYLALKCVATVGGSWMLPADAVKSGNWEEVTRFSREAVELVKR
ncbi:bifunctional 4-hydroxy-2-oxoglutarate aldolase/2-dehydro-3-deoxy-phosphogluconate aldolase [Aeromonas caviae]|uniref:bifunctional 4-hydroxy-2-oxoglutarate aldolase/2-dehydro-3-deoxy-phosphogluconate aldolase n=1 Tax=Aeromonas sp. 62-46 TaxID=1895698 RepID=UPI000925DA33|nr:bifunctional 4-hydroxy-2-oxoglutarate aldolase/2-dehydro-3-deoxy-phosphogluconate aldolase [Aeromonas sp. 62-46]OJW67956.1 MAG: keto-deoxy-phosphogluconate aldolase [Aeromonas sp. 62-46]